MWVQHFVKKCYLFLKLWRDTYDKLGLVFCLSTAVIACFRLRQQTVNIYVLIWLRNRSVSTEVSNCEMSWLPTTKYMTFYIIDARELEGKVWGKLRGKFPRKVIPPPPPRLFSTAVTCYINGVCGIQQKIIACDYLLFIKQKQ